MTEKRKVYFIHGGGMGLLADCFIKIKKKITEDNAYDYGIDYYMPDCPYVKKFLEKNPDYEYVGSTDNLHMYGDGDGWGMDLSKWTRVCVFAYELFD